MISSAPRKSNRLAANKHSSTEADVTTTTVMLSTLQAAVDSTIGKRAAGAAGPGARELGISITSSRHDEPVRGPSYTCKPVPNASPSKFIFDLEPPSHDPRPKNLKRDGKPNMTAGDSL